MCKSLIVVPLITIGLVACDESSISPSQDAQAAEQSSSVLTLNERWKAGIDYRIMETLQPTNVKSGKIEVIEFFWYGCGHCFALEPKINLWNKVAPDYIKFKKIPVSMRLISRAHARLFYTLEALGRTDLHPAVFDAIHKQGNTLVAIDDESETRKLQLDFARSHGIPEEDFARTYNSITVNSNVLAATQMTKRYQIDGVPTVIVHGRYRVGLKTAYGQDEMMEIVSALAATENSLLTSRSSASPE